MAVAKKSVAKKVVKVSIGEARGRLDGRAGGERCWGKVSSFRVSANTEMLAGCFERNVAASRAPSFLAPPICSQSVTPGRAAYSPPAQGRDKKTGVYASESCPRKRRFFFNRRKKKRANVSRRSVPPVATLTVPRGLRLSLLASIFAAAIFKLPVHTPRGTVLQGSNGSDWARRGDSTSKRELCWPFFFPLASNEIAHPFSSSTVQFPPIQAKKPAVKKAAVKKVAAKKPAAKKPAAKSKFGDGEGILLGRC